MQVGRISSVLDKFYLVGFEIRCRVLEKKFKENSKVKLPITEKQVSGKNPEFGL